MLHEWLSLIVENTITHSLFPFFNTKSRGKVEQCENEKEEKSLVLALMLFVPVHFKIKCNGMHFTVRCSFSTLLLYNTSSIFLGMFFFNGCCCVHFFFTKPHKVIHLMIQLTLSVMDFLHLSRKKETQNTVKKYTHMAPVFFSLCSDPVHGLAWTILNQWRVMHL